MSLSFLGQVNPVIFADGYIQNRSLASGAQTEMTPIAEKSNGIEIVGNRINTFSRIGDTIESVVNHTTQTFVQNLKTDNLFNGDMQIEAMRLSRQAAINMLDAESTALIKDLHGDLNAWIETQIESVIYEQGLVKFMTEQKS